MDDRPIPRYARAPDGVNLCYRLTGGGPSDLVWLPSVAYPVDLLWEEPGFVRLCRRLARFSTTMWPEGRGIGASGGAHLDNFLPGAYARDLTSLVEDAGFAQFVLVASGLSGWRAVEYAVSEPSRITALVLIDSFAHYIREPDYAVGFSAEFVDSLVANTRERWGTGVNMPLAPSKAGDSGFQERIARGERLGITPEEAAAAFQLSLARDVRGLLAKVAVPTLVLQRQSDVFVTPDAGRYLADHIPEARYVELPGEDHLFYVGDVDALADEIEDFLTGARQGPEGDVATKSILFTDIVSSTEQAASLGHRKWTSVMADHDAMVRAALRHHQGEEVKSTGDGFLAVFDAATKAVRAAIEVVTRAEGLGIQLRAGVHTGEVEVRPDDVVGLPVNVAKRVCDLAAPSQVLATEIVRLQAAGSDIALNERGVFELKGVPGTWEVFAVVNDSARIRGRQVP